MLNIYYGSEKKDKEKFIFENIKGRTLLLVPDQFSLQAERDAFFYLGKKAVMDLAIVDFSSLGHKVINEAGTPEPHLIDKYGRHMLLTRIIDEESDSLKIFGSMRGRTSFTEILNDLISEMKRFRVSPDELAEAGERLGGDSFLKYKLSDIEKLYRIYEEKIEGKYLDSEDYISFYGEKILASPMIRGSHIWIYGFDTFTPRNMDVIESLIRAAQSVNVVMNWDDEPFDAWDAGRLAAEDSEQLFSITGHVIRNLEELGEKAGAEVRRIPINGETRKNIWTAAGEERAISLTLAESPDIYSEADRAAAFILELVRDRGYRFGEIVAVCNDMELRGRILKRTFARWGIPAFMDTKRQVLHHPAVRFILSLVEAVVRGYRDEAVMEMVKSGFLDIDEELAQILENYAREYRIRGGAWKKEFTRGSDRYGEDGLADLNRARDCVCGLVEELREEMGRKNTAGEKVTGLYDFLHDSFLMEERLKSITEDQEEAGLAEGAAETAQSWNMICAILDQIVETMGDEKISGEDLLGLLEAGFEEMEIGLVPVDSDSVVIGTMQRTRLSRIKALLVTGANESILPLETGEEGILSEREKELLKDMDIEISKRDNVLRQEERLAVYRTFSLPEEALYVSCGAMNEKGEETRPSAVFRWLMERKPESAVAGDLVNGRFADMVASKKGALPYMAEALRSYANGGEADSRWRRIADWYRKNDPEDLKRIERGIAFTNRMEDLGEKFADALYRGDRKEMTVSASRLEKYSSCPFAHFMGYGIRPEELRVFEMGAREIGDVYHRCLMRFSRKLTEGIPEGESVSSPGSRWMTVTEEECGDEIKRILEEDKDVYMEGLMASGGAEMYRSERIEEDCRRIAWSLVSQVRKGHVKNMVFEAPFGRGGIIPSVEVDLGERKVFIEGKIDRADILEKPDGSGEAVRIIDYKTGNDVLDPEYFREGYKLQLMIYMEAALKGAAGREVGVSPEPAGIFYFRIKDMEADADKMKIKEGEEALRERAEAAYRLEGITLSDPALIEAMDDGFEAVSKVIPVKRGKNDGGYTASAGGKLMTGEEFRELCAQMDRQVERICRRICQGDISIQPKRERKKNMDGSYRTSCAYCRYRSICMFDTAFDGCRFTVV